MSFRKAKILITVFLATLGIASNLTFAQEQRMALVIGNSQYQNLPQLRNPANDAETMSKALANLGFTVFLANNLKHSELVRALGIYSKKSQKADISLIYFAGHGAALGNQNLMFPIDFDPKNSQHLDALVKLSDVSKLMQNGSRTNVIFFDACQEPLTLQTPGGQIDLKAVTPNVPPIGTLISYASATGSAAHDGSGNHSIFTGALLDNLGRPDTDIETMLRLVRRDVIQNSQGTQVPQTSSALVSEFMFYPTQNKSLNTSLQTALTQNGFSQKPILNKVSNGLTAPVETQKFSTEQLILRDVLCKKLSAPLPQICEN